MATFKEYLTETKMSITELDKKASNGPFSGETRTSILKKLINKDEFDDLRLALNSGEEIDLDFSNPKLQTLSRLLKTDMKTSDWDDLRAFFKDNKPFISTDGTEYKLSDLKKNLPFGSGKGSGGGSEDTKLNESLQCIIGAIAAKLKNSDLENSDITVEMIEKVKSHFDIDLSETNAEKLYESIFRDKGWTTSYLQTANILQKKYSFDTSYHFHRQSDWVKELYDQAKTLFKDIKDLPFTDPNKWNPADMWITKGKVKIPDFDTLPELNNWLIEKFKDEEVIGVSLKKVSDRELTIKNIDNEVNKLNDFDHIELVMSKGANPFSAKDTYILFEAENKIQFRAYNAGQNIQSELQGKKSAHGKAGFGAIQGVLKYIGLDQLKTQKELLKLIDNDETDPKKKYAKIFDVIKDYIKPFTKTPEKIETEFYANDKLDNDWIISKCQAAELLWKLKQKEDSVKKLFIVNLNAIISSEHEYSSVHVKIH